MTLKERLRYHVTGAIERGEAVAIVEQPVSRYEVEIECPSCNSQNIDVLEDEWIECKECDEMFLTKPKPVL